MSDFKEGDRVQYKVDLSSENMSEGTIQKVIKGGESVREVPVAHQFVPRYVRLNRKDGIVMILDY